MNFKEQYLLGLCDIDHIEACIERWHQLPEDGVSIIDYLGLTTEEYDVFLQTDLSHSFRELLDSQRRHQRYRIYQLDFESGKTIPYAFAGVSALRKAGYEQPPAADYRLVYDGELICPKEQAAEEVLEHIFKCFSDTLPSGYPGRNVSASDVVELYGDGIRTYYYRDTAGFVPVKFSPMLAKPMKKWE